ncbi:hypothetical protein ACTG5T_03365 [Pasteurella multocida]
MSNSLPFDPFGSSQQPEKAKKSFSYVLGRGLGKAVVFARNKLSGVSQAVHHSIEDDVQRRLAEQEAFHGKCCNSNRKFPIAKKSKNLSGVI